MSETVEELMQSVREHSRHDHRMTEIDDGFRAELLKAVGDV
ncbi:hypothetical protein BH23GEM6_BH23GEM6_25470 [soil metagenome]